MHKNDLLQAYQRVRRASIDMCEPLWEQDYWLKQPMEEVSPPGWNLGHTSWFFRKVIECFGGSITKQDKQYDYFLNSYYSVIGERIARHSRGDQAWIPLPQLFAYRTSVDQRISELISNVSDALWEKFVWAVTLGLHHERQHQELFYTEIKYSRFVEPDQRPYRAAQADHQSTKAYSDPQFLTFEGGLFEFGNLESPWCFDNELGVHQSYLSSFCLSDRLLTNGEFLEFIEDGGYKREHLWQAAGWYELESQKWQAPLYWDKAQGSWRTWTLCGWQPLDPNEPVCHVSFWEAESFCHWKNLQSKRLEGVRLPTEYEWELAARSSNAQINQDLPWSLRPSAYDGKPFSQMFHNVWEWTGSTHVPYPGYRPFPEPFTEYTSKFFYGPLVLKGGSCVSAPDHLRVSYRNYWSPSTRFQFSGIRLAQGNSLG